MFRHQGETRTLSHNLKIASLLSFVAGIVNIAGFLSIQRLTTNVTGHFAFLIDEVFKFEFLKALNFFLYILFFFFGSFTSSFIVELVSRKNEKFIYVIPTLIEAFLLAVLPIFGKQWIVLHPDTLACCLLFAMGLQNSLVTSLSNSVVRTTHLTGLFTDLGIELSQLLFYRAREERAKLLSSISLRITIIVFFFIGGTIGGVLYARFHLWVLLVASFSLLAGLVYDSLRFRFMHLKKPLPRYP